MARNPVTSIVVLGSLHVELLAQVAELPRVGETAWASGLMKRLGGKGGNQALAAARQGVQVTLIGCLGDDPEGRDYRNHLRREGVNCSSLNTVRGNTGTAFIFEDPQGGSQGVVVAGANAALTEPSVKMQRARIAVAKLLLLQLEIPLESAVEAIRIANEAKVPVVLNASPIQSAFPWGQVTVDVLILRESEALAVFATTEPTRLKEKLAGLRIRHLILTRGAQPTRCITKTEVEEVPAHPVTPVDVSGAGDTFVGAFAAHFAEHGEVKQAVAWANTAAALATLKNGVQEGMPHRGDVQSAMTVRQKSAE